MEALLDRLSSGQIVAVISILVGGIVAVAMIWAITKFQCQWQADEAALRGEKQRADLTLREKLVERYSATGGKVPIEELLALGLGEPDAENVDAQLAKRFGALDTSAEAIEQALGRAMATDPARKKLIIGVMDELIGCDAEPDAILAAVRPLCGVTKMKAAEHAA
jgi:hypothetical protein